MSEASRKLFCFGYGYSCDYLGYELQQQGNWVITGTTRDPEKKAMMKERGIKTVLFDHKSPLGDPELFLKDVTHLLISTPPNDAGDPVFLMHAQDILRQQNTLQWIGYLSSTGVYGNHNGDWVDENTETRPNNKRSSRRIVAEKQWLSLYEKHGLPVHIFRLSGIYGPGRSALDSVRAGMARRIDKPGHVFSRVHVDDIIQTLLASMNNLNPGSVYNICDDSAAPSHEVIEYACRLLGLEPPPLTPFSEADISPIARSFYNDNKQVHNEKIKIELGVALRYPDFKAGLEACLEAEQRANEAAKDSA